MTMIQPIVEGHGDVAAFPVLLRRLIDEAQAWNVGIGRPIRSPLGAKEQLEGRMEAGSSYLERTDQPAFSARFSLPDAYRRCRSFRKLAGSFGLLVSAMGQETDTWPPADWNDEGDRN